MADDTRAKDTDAPKPAEAAKAAKAEAPDDPTYSVDRILAESDLLVGHPSHVVAGALASISKKNLTINEVKAAVDAFLATEVK